MSVAQELSLLTNTVEAHVDEQRSTEQLINPANTVQESVLHLHTWLIND